RHLREAGTSFRRVRDELRRDLAHRYLTDSEISIAEIALLLGYSEASAFNRAFKSWHAEGPAQFRRRAHAARHELSTR
ncbi:MAG: helix-turn-helix domain-containing protein, partial [Myxococcota bacterium]